MASSAGLPRLAEDALASSSASSAAPLTVGDAIRKLRTMRAALLGELTPQESYALAKRSLLNQAHLRATIELLEGRPPAGQRTARPDSADAAGARKRQRV